MNILSEMTALVAYGKIKEIDTSSKELRDKVDNLREPLSRIFNEITQGKINRVATLNDKMQLIKHEWHEVSSTIIGNAINAKNITNIAHHPENPQELFDVDYRDTVKWIAECIQYFSDIPIPPEVSAIYGKNAAPTAIPTPVAAPTRPLAQTPVITPAKPVVQLRPRETPPPLTLRQQDLANNPTPRLPVALLLDTSGSMTVDNKIQKLNDRVELFFNSILEDEVTRYSVELSIITFGDKVNTVLNFGKAEGQIEEFKKNMPLTVKSINDGTPMGEAVERAVALLNAAKAEYKGIVEYFQPWLVLMTDGKPTDNVDKAVALTTELVNMGKLTLFPVAIGSGANIDVLQRLSPRYPVFVVEDLNFREFFERLKASAKDWSQSTPDGKTPDHTMLPLYQN
jgi:uncharacterized protein YegL